MNDAPVLRVAAVAVLLVGMLPWSGGCANTPNLQEPPEIPPASTFVMDFGDFAGGGAPKLIPGTIDPVTAQMIPGGNWAWSALKVGVWNVIITVGLAVPVAAFVASFEHEPEAQDDGTWAWTYDVPVGGTTYTARLTAAAIENGIEWNMYVSKEGDYTDFNWFTGESNLVGTAGTWTLNKNPQDPTPLLDIEWSRNEEAETGDIKYTNIESGSNDEGSYIAYAKSTGLFDASFELLNNDGDNLTTIQWSTSGHDGRIMDPARFNDNEWHCWDGDLQNADCPQ
jgi:hypothetical protein